MSIVSSIFFSFSIFLSKYSGVQNPTTSINTFIPSLSKEKSGMITYLPAGIGSGSLLKCHPESNPSNRVAKLLSTVLSYGASKAPGFFNTSPWRRLSILKSQISFVYFHKIFACTIHSSAAMIAGKSFAKAVPYLLINLKRLAGPSILTENPCLLETSYIKPSFFTE